MVKDFSQVGTGNRPVAATGSTGGGSGFFSDRKRVIATGVVAVVFLALVIALLTSGGGDDNKGSGADAIRAAHGPTTTIDGVPAGYTRDQAGAQTAAVNFIQADGQTYQGRIDVAKLREVAVASDPSPSLQSVLDISSGRTDLGKTVNNVPLIVTVTDFTQDSATVSVWGMGVGQSPVSEGSDKVGILTVYSTTTVTVKWENGDWKAQDWKFVSGPSADDAQFPAADSALSKPGANGFYTFYVN